MTGSAAIVAERWARFAALALAILGVLLLMGAALSSDVQPDADAYWLAAQRLREGIPLYSGGGTDETEIYRYAPWFAYAWVPMTYLGYDGAMLAWRAILLLATVTGWIGIGPAVFLHEGSSLVVIANSLRLLAYE